MGERYDAIVIGGGYFGCAAAYALGKGGARTLLLEKNEIGGGASGANFGNVQVQDASMGLSLELTLDGFRKMQGMEEELGCDIGYRPCGSLITAETQEHLEELELLYRQKKDAGLDIKWMDTKELAAAEPRINPYAVEAATYYMQGSVYPFHYMYGLLRRAKEHGLTLREFTGVASLLVEGGACTGAVLWDGETLRADHVVVAAGSGTRPLCRSAGLDVPVRSVKAESFVTEAIKPFLNNYYSSAAFFAEAHDQQKASASLCVSQSHYGNLLIGETTKPHELVSPEHQDCTSPEHCRWISQKLAHLFPALNGIKILRSWVTASPFTDSNEPIFGKSPVPGLLIAAGFKSAVVMSGLAGEIIADLVLRDGTKYNLAPFMAKVQAVTS